MYASLQNTEHKLQVTTNRPEEIISHPEAKVQIIERERLAIAARTYLHSPLLDSWLLQGI